MHIEAAALVFSFDGRKYEVGGGGPEREYLSVRAVEFEAGGVWPTDDELSRVIGLTVRFFEAGTRAGEALYAFEVTQ